LEVIHIPILSGENNAMQFSIQDLIIHGRDIIPDHITFRSTSAGDYHIQKRKKNSMKTFVTMEIKHFGLHAHGFKFFYNKLTGFPKLKDEGIANLDVGGRGNVLALVWKIKSKDGILHFSVKDVVCHIDKFKLKIVQARHGFLDRLGVALASGTMKKKLERAIVDGVANSMDGFNRKMNQALLPADKRGLYRKTKIEKGAYGIPEDLTVGASETYVHTDPYTTRFGKSSVTY